MSRLRPADQMPRPPDRPVPAGNAPETRGGEGGGGAYRGGPVTSTPPDEPTDKPKTHTDTPKKA